MTLYSLLHDNKASEELVVPIFNVKVHGREVHFEYWVLQRAAVLMSLQFVYFYAHIKKAALTSHIYCKTYDSLTGR
jgi:hypothetical protein